jgi:beta-N-acetylhexosaminidase
MRSRFPYAAAGLLLFAVLAGACAPGTGLSMGGPSDTLRPGLPSADRWADRTLERLSVRQKVAQLVMPRVGSEYVPVGSGQYERLRYWVSDLQVGGVIISIGSPTETAARLNMLQAMAAVPLLVSADMEHGPGQALRGGTVLPYGLETGGGTRFPPLMALGATNDPRLARELGRVTAVEGRAAGVHITFAPVVDVNNNPANPIINTRSYGADAELVSRMATSHIRGIQDHGMLATAKHFPGHGDTHVDSHIELPYIAVDRARFDAVELVPYRSAIDAGVAGIMTAHIAFPALSGDSLSATLNRRLITGLLREELGYDGLVFTDALDMGAIVNAFGTGEAAVLAIEAGADVLLQMLPDEVANVIDAVIAAIEDGRLTEQRIDTSVRRVLRAKERLGLAAGAGVDLERIAHVVGRPEHAAVAAEAARRSITVARDRDGLLPVRGRVLSIVYTDVLDPFAGRAFQAELAASLPDITLLTLDARADADRLAEILAEAEHAELVLFSPFTAVVAGRAGPAVAAGVARALNELAGRRPVVLTSFGDPYLLQQFPDVGTYMLAWGPWEPAQRAAARALLGDAPVDGRLPIPIPPFHAIGEGLSIPARSR